MLDDQRRIFQIQTQSSIITLKAEKLYGLWYFSFASKDLEELREDSQKYLQINSQEFQDSIKKLQINKTLILYEEDKWQELFNTIKDHIPCRQGMGIGLTEKEDIYSVKIGSKPPI